MSKYKLVMNNEQLQLLAKHLGELKHIYNIMIKYYKEKQNDNVEMQQFYQTYADEVELLIMLLFTVFKTKKKSKGDRDE